MPKYVYIRKCENCGEDVYGILTSSFEDSFTVLFECSQCGQVWSEDKQLDAGSDDKAGKKESGADDGAGGE